MAKVISTYGVGTKFVTSALMGLGATEQAPNGRFAIDGSLVNVEMSRVIAEAIYIKEIFRDGQSVSGRYTTDLAKGGAVRVPLATPFPFTSRTISFGGRAGTPGNAGVINSNAPMMTADDEFLVYLNQVNDQPILFPDMKRELMPLDTVARKINSYAERVAMDRSASTLAEIIGYAYFRAMNDGENLVNHGDLTEKNAYATLIAKLNGKMDDGDQVTGAFTFPTEGRTIIGRSEFINNIFNLNSGLVVLGGDLAQEMLKNYDLDAAMSERDYVGANFRGNSGNFNFVMANSVIWSLAEMYLGLPAGALNNVDAIAVSFDATAMARGVDLGVKVIDAQPTRGALAQPLNMWGHEAFRKSFVIGDSTLTTTYLNTTLGLSDSTRLRPIAPFMKYDAQGVADPIAEPVYDQNGVVNGYKPKAFVIKPNADNIQSGIPRVYSLTSDTPSGAVASGTKVKLSTPTADAKIYYTTNGTDPTTASTAYTSAGITISAATDIKAIAVKQGSIPSPILALSYTIQA